MNVSKCSRLLTMLRCTRSLSALRCRRDEEDGQVFDRLHVVRNKRGLRLSSAASRFRTCGVVFSEATAIIRRLPVRRPVQNGETTKHA